MFIANHIDDNNFSYPTSGWAKLNNSTCSGCVPAEIFQEALWDEGLMIERIVRNVDVDYNVPTNRYDGYDSSRDLVPSDNDLSKSQACDTGLNPNVFPTQRDVYDGDLWSPENVKQMSPWTRPNVYGYTFAGDVPSSFFLNGWHTLDNIRYTSAGDGTIAFDYIKRPQNSTAPFTIREDSWMGAESDNLVFQGEVRVQNGATLTFEADPTGGRTIDFAGGLFIGNGTVVIEDGVTLRFGDDKQLIVFGELDVNGGSEGVTFAPISTSDGWGGLNYRPNSTGTMQNATITGVGTSASGSSDNSVYVLNANIFFEGVTIEDGAGDGLFVVGSAASVTMNPTTDRLSRIRDHAHRSVVSASGAEVKLQEVVIEQSGSVGIYANDGQVFTRLSTIDGSLQQGARAYGQTGRIVLGQVGNGNLVTGQNNLISDSYTHSLRVDMGGVVYGGGYGDQYDDNYRNNAILLDSENQDQKHALLDGGDVIAECSYWDDPNGPDSGKVKIEAGGGVFDGGPYLSNPPNVSTLCSYADLTGGGSSSARSAGASEFAGGHDGVMHASADDQGGPPIGMALDRWYAIVDGVENSDREVGIGHVVRAIQRAEGEHDTRRAFEVAAQLGQEGVHPGLEGFLQGQSRTPKHRGYALEALATIYYGTGRMTEARATADMLLAEFPATPHARRGWLTHHAVSRDVGDYQNAEAALSAVRAGWPDYEVGTLENALEAASKLNAEGQQMTDILGGFERSASETEIWVESTAGTSSPLVTELECFVLRCGTV